MILNDTAIERAIYDEPQGDTSKFAATKANPFLVAALSGSQSKAPGFAGGYLLGIAESRRNACLHEIERRRAVLGETLRRSVQEIEDGEFEVIETTPAQGKDVA